MQKSFLRTCRNRQGGTASTSHNAYYPPAPTTILWPSLHDPCRPLRWVKATVDAKRLDADVWGSKRCALLEGLASKPTTTGRPLLPQKVGFRNKYPTTGLSCTRRSRLQRTPTTVRWIPSGKNSHRGLRRDVAVHDDDPCARRRRRTLSGRRAGATKVVVDADPLQVALIARWLHPTW